MVIAVGGGVGAGQRRVGEQAVVEHIEGFALVAKVVFAAAGRTGGGGARRGVGRRRRGARALVGALVIDVGGLRVTRGGETALVWEVGVSQAQPSWPAAWAAQRRSGRGRKQSVFICRQRMCERAATSWLSRAILILRSGGSWGKVAWLGIKL